MKRVRTPTVDKPDPADFTSLCIAPEDEEKVLDAALKWLGEGSIDQQADRSNFFHQLLYHRMGLDESGVKNLLSTEANRLPSFSSMRWDTLASVYHFGESFAGILDEQPVYVVPSCILPFSLHREMRCLGWIKMDVNGDVGLQKHEAGVVNIAQYAIEAVAALFCGRIVNRSEAPLPRNLFSTGGRVEYQLYTVGGTLLVIAEFKRGVLTNDNCAQLFAELLSAAKINRPNKQRVHGVLSNLDFFYFYSYNPVTDSFAQGEQFTTAGTNRLERLNKMVPLINHLFSVCLEGLKEYVSLSKIISETRCDSFNVSSGDANAVSVLPVPPALGDGPSTARLSTPLWVKTFELLCEAQAKLRYPEGLDFRAEWINERGEEGIVLLQQALQTLPRISVLGIEKSSPQNLEDLKIFIDEESAKHEQLLCLQWRLDRS